MAFKLDDLIIDSIDMAVATDFDDNPLYVLTQLSEASIEISAESDEAVDKKGTLIKKFWKSKAGTFSATNAMLNLNVVAAMSGDNAKKTAAAGATIEMPKIIVVSSSVGQVDLGANVKPGSVRIAGMANNGAMDTVTKYEAASQASNNKFVVADTGMLTLPTVDNVEVPKFVIFYKRNVTDGVMIENRADKFPGTVRLYIKALCVEPCSADTLRAATIYLPSFQVSPEVSISLSTDGTIDYTGDLQVAYCGDDKVLYQVFVASDDVEDDD